MKTETQVKNASNPQKKTIENYECLPFSFGTPSPGKEHPVAQGYSMHFSGLRNTE
jgi:hypothetical protein